MSKIMILNYKIIILLQLNKRSGRKLMQEPNSKFNFYNKYLVEKKSSGAFDPEMIVGDYVLERSEGLDQFLQSFGYSTIKRTLLQSVPVTLKVHYSVVTIQTTVKRQGLNMLNSEIRTDIATARF